MGNSYRIAALVAITVATVACTASLVPIGQDPTYHNFADGRVFLGVANFLDVASNLPFLFVGLWGLFVVFNWRTTFVANIERWPYTIFFLGVALTSVGSSYYHLHPDNTRLVWDRLPMTLGFMGILSAVLAERVNRKASVVLLPLLVFAGIASVIYWYATETGGNGDLRPYLLVQFGSLLIVVVSFLLFRSPYTQQKWFVVALSAYVTAKLLEIFDEKVYGALRFVSGHTLKHLMAAAAACCIVQMLRQRSIAHAGSTLWRVGSPDGTCDCSDRHPSRASNYSA